jgi:uncharacterized membrane-anchored protein
MKMKMKGNSLLHLIVFSAVTLFWATTVYAQGQSGTEPESIYDLDWDIGPTEGLIGDKAKMHVPEGYAFLGREGTKRAMEMMENIPSGNEYLLAKDDLSWFAVFEFNPVGYVKDDDTLDSEALLDSITRGTEQGNVERKKRGWGAMTILGWRFEPRYDDRMNLLEWAFMANQDESNEKIVNYNTRLLARTGVMEVVLVADPEALDASVTEFKQIVNGYSFLPGEKYNEYRKGDRVAEFGLAALVAGGAAAVATKKGLWGVIAGFFAVAWKFIAAAAFGLVAWLGSLFKRK